MRYSAERRVGACRADGERRRTEENGGERHRLEEEDRTGRKRNLGLRAGCVLELSGSFAWHSRAIRATSIYNELVPHWSRTAAECLDSKDNPATSSGTSVLTLPASVQDASYTGHAIRPTTRGLHHYPPRCTPTDNNLQVPGHSINPKAVQTRDQLQYLVHCMCVCSAIASQPVLQRWGGFSKQTNAIAMDLGLGLFWYKRGCPSFSKSRRTAFGRNALTISASALRGQVEIGDQVDSRQRGKRECRCVSAATPTHIAIKLLYLSWPSRGRGLTTQDKVHQTKSLWAYMAAANLERLYDIHAA